MLEADVAESIQRRLDRVLDHLDEIGAEARQIVLSHDDLHELKGDPDPEPDQPSPPHTYRDVAVKRGEIGQSSYVEASGAPSGDANFGV